MIRYTVTVRPHASIFIGGYAASRGESDGDTANDKDGMLIPGSGLKGALRESATRLVNGTKHGYEALRKIFGEDKCDGVIRVGPLRARVGDRGDPLPDVSTRHHVSLVRATRQAAAQRLFQNRVTAAGHDLTFRGELIVTQVLTEKEEGLLEGARILTDQIGGGRGRGLGLVEVTWTRQQEEDDVSPSEEEQKIAELFPEQISTVVLVLRAEEPLRLGIVKDRTNVESSKAHLDGSAVRGAVAAALDRIASKDVLEEVLGTPAPVIFGNGYPAHLSAIPAPLTLREPKQGGPPSDDAVRLCAYAVGSRASDRVHDTRATKGSFGLNCRGWTQVKIEKRMVTRTARNLVDGRAAEGRLFSLEILEPRLSDSPWNDDDKLRFFVPVTGTAEQLLWVVKAASNGLLLGGARSRGLGRAVLEEVRRDGYLPPVAERHASWVGLLESLHVEHPERTGVLLAVGPLAVDQRRLLRSLEHHHLKLVHGVSRRQTHGGWNAAMRLPRTVASQFVTGSTFIVKSTSQDSALPALENIEEQGIGPGRADGWGRLIACHPIHVECFKEKRP